MCICIICLKNNGDEIYHLSHSRRQKGPSANSVFDGKEFAISSHG